MIAARRWRYLLPALAVVSLVIVTWVQPRFLSGENLGNVARQSVPLAIFALAQMLPLLTRGLDLSQGGIVVAASVTFANVAHSTGTPAGVLAALTVGLAAGTTNGLVIAGFEVSPFVVTLATGSVLQGLALIGANGQPISDVPASVGALFYTELLGVPVPVLVLVLLFALQWFGLERLRAGRYVYAVGSNDRAAYLAGVPVRATLVLAYSASGLWTSVGSILLSSRIASGHPTAGSDTALQAVAASVIGGVSLLGGRGTAGGVLLGAAFLGLLSNALNLLNVSSFVQYVAIGGAIVVAAVADRIRSRTQL